MQNQKNDPGMENPLDLDLAFILILIVFIICDCDIRHTCVCSNYI